MTEDNKVPWMGIMSGMSMAGNDKFLRDKYALVVNKEAFDWLYKLIETRYWYTQPIRMPKDQKESLKNLWLEVRHLASERESYEDVEVK